MPFVISATALTAYKRCPKSYWFGFEKYVSPVETKGIIQQGIDFHSIAAAYAQALKTGSDFSPPDTHDDAMYPVFVAWLNNRGGKEFDNMEILHVEEPMFTRLYDDVWLRTTLDLVYRRADGWIVIRDYKTFSAFPSKLDASLDFQARVYIAAIMLKYGTSKVTFEHVYVRRELNHTGKQAHVAWTPEESYVYDDIVISKEEAMELWKETAWVAGEIVNKRAIENPYEGQWYRVDHKGYSPFTCGSCFYKGVCDGDLTYGVDLLDLEELGYEIKETERNSHELPA